jgi:CubicO group peptidase (beta-lactamase class C family)
MNDFAATMLVDHVNFDPDGNGWSIISNTARAAFPSDKLREFESGIVQLGTDWKNIRERMATHNVPGIGVAVVLDNRLAWATSYGRVEKSSDHWIHNDTVFQAASCSKPVSTLGFLRLVQSGLIGLDDDVNPKLGWKLPKRPCAQEAWKTKVTLRRLLRHRGGIIGRGATNPTSSCSNFADNGGGGFGGYEDAPGVGIPTVREILEGTSNRPGVTVNSHKVELTYDPGSMSAYSGEGFVLMMQLFERQQGSSLGTWMRTNVFADAGMTHSTYALQAPSFSGPPASGHDGNGNVIAGKRRRYPESSAAGLYTTPSDLGRFIIAINQGGSINGHQILDSTRHQSLMNDGLGMPTGGVGTNDEWFWHNGANAGFRCQFKGYPKKRAGFAIMTNGDSGGDLYDEIAAALIRTYSWE